MKFHAMASAVALFLVSSAAFAQDSKTPPAPSASKAEQAPQANPFSTFNKFAYARVKTILISSAEKNARGELQLQAYGSRPQLRPACRARGRSM